MKHVIFTILIAPVLTELLYRDINALIQRVEILSLVLRHAVLGVRVYALHARLQVPESIK